MTSPARTTRDVPAPVPAGSPSEFVLTAEDFRTIQETLHADAGIALDETKVPLVYSRLAKRVRALGLASFKDYCRLVLSQEGVDERQRMLAALTTNVTRFFREPHHFEHLRRTVLPPLLASAARGNQVRIWSAGCSTGQEPYSIALTILGLAPNAPGLDIRILATDIDPNVVATARRAEYPDDLVRDIPGELRSRWLKRAAGSRDGNWVMSDDVRSLVRVNELNLIREWPMRRPFHAIFCRNVVIYFDEQTQAKIWRRYADALVPGGTMFIGHSERVLGPAQSRFSTTGLTTYTLNGA